MSNYSKAGLRSVGNYQAAGWPFITGSADLDQNVCHRVDFPSVTRSVTVINTNTTNGYDIRVHFQGGAASASFGGNYDTGGHQAIADTDDVIARKQYVTVPAGYGSLTMDIKCKHLFISHNAGSFSNLTYQVFAELTGIPTGSMPHLTGSGITGIPVL